MSQGHPIHFRGLSNLNNSCPSISWKLISNDLALAKQHLIRQPDSSFRKKTWLPLSTSHTSYLLTYSQNSNTVMEKRNDNLKNFMLAIRTKKYRFKDHITYGYECPLTPVKVQRLKWWENAHLTNIFTMGWVTDRLCLSFRIYLLLNRWTNQKMLL